MRVSAGDHDRRRPVRVRKGGPQLRQHVRLPRRLPALEGDDRRLPGTGDEPAPGLVGDITANYPPTLAAWRRRFLATWERLRRRGYDERFRRLWVFYLTISEAGFREGRIGDVQALFEKQRYSRAR
ncbi:MAG TPA: class I SAM-dependent methyltransferase [Solirubrobacterales bacterium]|nr:class I SAM-dependent methyltransferase [Solirubrobacterales bacterium]